MNKYELALVLNAKVEDEVRLATTTSSILKQVRPALLNWKAICTSWTTCSDI